MPQDVLALSEKMRIIRNITSIFNQSGYSLSKRKIDEYLYVKNLILENKYIFTIYRRSNHEKIARISFENSFFNGELPGRIVWDIFLYKYKFEAEMKKLIRKIQKENTEIKFRLMIGGNY